MKYLLIISFSLICSMLYAQNLTDSVHVTTKETATDSKFIGQMDTINLHRDLLLQIKYDELVKTDSAKSIELKQTGAQIKENLEKIDSYFKQIAIADSLIIDFSSNFIYIPYDAYSVEKLAIPAFKIVYDQKLKDQHSIRLTLLENYYEDIKLLHSFLSVINIDLSKRFAKSNVSKPLIQDMKEKPFYILYSQYEDYKNTFLGSKFIEIEKRLNEHDGDKYIASFDDIIEQLNNCLKINNNL